jgi:hypothetical protein
MRRSLADCAVYLSILVLACVLGFGMYILFMQPASTQTVIAAHTGQYCYIQSSGKVDFTWCITEVAK